MKTSKKVINTLTAVMLGSVITTAALALPIPGLQKTPPGAAYTESGVTNHNVEALLAYPPQALEKSIAPYLPAGQSMAAIAKGVTPLLPAGIGRKQVLEVEPVLTQGIPDKVASGKVLVNAIQQASKKSYPILIYVDAGSYQLTDDSFTVPRNVGLAGVGRASTHIEFHEFINNGWTLNDLDLSGDKLTLQSAIDVKDTSIEAAVTAYGKWVNFFNVLIAGQTMGLQIDTTESFSITNSKVVANTTALTVASQARGLVSNNLFKAKIPIEVTANSCTLFSNNLYSGGTPHFYGDYKTSQQRCHNDIDATGLPVPNYASGVSPLCVAPTTG